jgi:hypothetical protein
VKLLVRRISHFLDTTIQRYRHLGGRGKLAVDPAAQHSVASLRERRYRRATTGDTDSIQPPSQKFISQQAQLAEMTHRRRNAYNGSCNARAERRSLSITFRAAQLKYLIDNANFNFETLPTGQQNTEQIRLPIAPAAIACGQLDGSYRQFHLVQAFPTL